MTYREWCEDNWCYACGAPHEETCDEYKDKLKKQEDKAVTLLDQEFEEIQDTPQLREAVVRTGKYSFERRKPKILEVLDRLDVTCKGVKQDLDEALEALYFLCESIDEMTGVYRLPVAYHDARKLIDKLDSKYGEV